MESAGRLSSLFGSSYVVNEDTSFEAIERIASDLTREECSFYHLSMDELVRRVKLWHLKLPRVQPHYAVKCNDSPAVLKTLALLGTGFDCASRAEMNKVTDLGVVPSRIIFAHPCKIASHVKHAQQLGIKLMTFDSHEELKKIAKLYPDAELVIRIRCDAESAQCQLGMKFGVEPQEARSLLSFAAKLGLKVVGVAFHVGSGCAEPTVFLRAIKFAKQVFLEAVQEGHSPTLLDIGGGFLGGKQDGLDDAADCINTALDEYFPEGEGVRVIAEPGRFMVASAFTLATPIINRREVRLSAEEACPALTATAGDGMLDAVMYFIDDGLYGSFNCVLYDHQVVRPLPLKEHGENTSISSVWGPTCDGFDQVISSMLLPTGLAVGDWLVWEEMGAYTLASAGQFNGFPVPGVKVHMHHHTRLYLESLLEASESSGSEQSSGICSEDESSAASTRPSSPKTRGKLASRTPKQCLDEQLRRAVLVAALFQDNVDGPPPSPASSEDTVASMVRKEDQEESREM